jgi:5-formyltetrahydrofolate cyclo-ligase
MARATTESERVRRSLRAALRVKRRAVPKAVREAAALRIARHAVRHFRLHPGQRVALYAPLADELDVAPLIAAVRRHGGRVYVPRITDRRRRRMRFVPLSGAMRRNRLGILEPESAHAVDARWLDLVFLPLVGFDVSGVRLGMGGGYYDRAFGYTRLRRTWRRPRLVGVAFALQGVATIEPAAHDVKLDAVVTEEGVIECSTGC